MGFLPTLTLILLTLKLLGVVSLSWFWVFAPVGLAVCLWLGIIILMVLAKLAE